MRLAKWSAMIAACVLLAGCMGGQGTGREAAPYAAEPQVAGTAAPDAAAARATEVTAPDTASVQVTGTASPDAGVPQATGTAALNAAVPQATGTAAASSHNPAHDTGSGGAASVREERVRLTLGGVFGSVSPHPYGELREPEAVRAFEEAIRTAERYPGELDMTEPLYDAVIEGQNGPVSIHLWLDEAAESGMFTYTEDTGTGYQLTKTSAHTLQQFIETVDYRWEDARRNGDVLHTPGGTENLEKWTAFLDRLEHKQPASVRIAAFTLEGDPVFSVLDYDGTRIRYIYDNRLDAFGDAKRRITSCKAVVRQDGAQAAEYILTGCGDKELNHAVLQVAK